MIVGFTLLPSWLFSTSTNIRIPLIRSPQFPACTRLPASSTLPTFRFSHTHSRLFEPAVSPQFQPFRPRPFQIPSQHLCEYLVCPTRRLFWLPNKKIPQPLDLQRIAGSTPDWIRTSDLQSRSKRNATTEWYEIIINKQAKRRWWSGKSRFHVNAVLICASLCIMCPIVHIAWRILRMGRLKACNCATIVV